MSSSGRGPYRFRPSRHTPAPSDPQPKAPLSTISGTQKSSFGNTPHLEEILQREGFWRGGFNVSTVASSTRFGSRDGAVSSEAEFCGILKLCQLPDGSLIVAESRSNALRRVYPATGVVETIIAAEDILQQPRGMCLLDNFIVVCDSGHHRLRLVSWVGEETASLAGTGRKGHKDGPLVTAQFNCPTDVCVAPDGSLLVVDQGNHCIRRVDLEKGKVTTWAGALVEGFENGPSTQAKFKSPVAIAIDVDNGVLVADQKNHVIRKISSDGALVSTVAGSGKIGCKDGRVETATLCSPCSLIVLPSGQILVADRECHCIRKISSDRMTISTFAGSQHWGSRDGKLGDAAFNTPTHILVSPVGDVFVADHGNNAIRCIWKDSSDPQGSGVRSIVFQTLESASRLEEEDERWLRSMEPESHDEGEASSAGASRRHLKRPSAEELAEEARLELRERAHETPMPDLLDVHPTPSSLMSAYDADLQCIFRYYCRLVDKLNRNDVMGKTGWSMLCKDSSAVDERTLLRADIDLVFLECQKRQKLAIPQWSQHRLAGSINQQSPAREDRLAFADFLTGLFLLACRKYLGGNSRALSPEQLNDFLVCYIIRKCRKIFPEEISPLKSRGIASPAGAPSSSTSTATTSSSVSHTPSESLLLALDDASLVDANVRRIWKYFESPLHLIFDHYADKVVLRGEADSWKDVRNAQGTLNFDEVLLFAREYDLCPGLVSKPSLLVLFRACCHTTGAKTSLGRPEALTFFEFLEFLGRVALYSFSNVHFSQVYPAPSDKIHALLEKLYHSNGAHQVFNNEKWAPFRIFSETKPAVEFQGREHILDRPFVQLSSSDVAFQYSDLLQSTGLHPLKERLGSERMAAVREALRLAEMEVSNPNYSPSTGRPPPRRQPSEGSSLSPMPRPQSLRLTAAEEAFIMDEGVTSMPTPGWSERLEALSARFLAEEERREEEEEEEWKKKTLQDEEKWRGEYRTFSPWETRGSDLSKGGGSQTNLEGTGEDEDREDREDEEEEVQVRTRTGKTERRKRKRRRRRRRKRMWKWMT